MRESQNRRAAIACIIFFCTALGQDITFVVKVGSEIPPCPGDPDVAVLCDL